MEDADRPAVLDHEQHGDCRRGRSSASAPRRPAARRRRSSGAGVITSPAVWSIRPSMWRRRSPSVISPTSRPSASATPTQPKRFSVITSRASRIGVSAATSGSSPAAVHQVADGAQHGARACRRDGRRGSPAAVKPRRSSRATASASPSAICRVVEVVGALTSSVASGASGSSSTTSAARPSALSAAAVMAISGMREALGVGERRRPARGSRRTWTAPGSRRPAPIMPRSPWLASAGVDEHGRRAGGGQGGGDLARHVAGLADAGADDPALRPRTAVSTASANGSPRPRPRAGQRLGLGLQHAAADGDGVESVIEPGGH